MTEKTEEEELPENTQAALEAMDALVQNHIQVSQQTITEANEIIKNQQTVITALHETIASAKAKALDADFTPGEDQALTLVQVMQNLKSIIEGAQVNKATHDALQDMWLLLSQRILTEDEYDEHFINKDSN